MMDYFHSKRAKSKSPMRTAQAVETPPAPVLTDEDEAFLARMESEGTPPELPERPRPQLPQRPLDLPEAGETQGNNAQLTLYDSSQNVPLPNVPDTPEDVTTTAGPEHREQEKGKGKEEGGKKSKWSFLRRDSRDVKRKNKERTATDLMSAAEHIKAADAQPNEDGQVPDPEAKKEEEEMASVLENLHLAAVDNRVFSMSKESRELLRKSVFQVPTAGIGIKELTYSQDSRSFSRTLSTVSPPPTGISNLS